MIECIFDDLQNRGVVCLVEFGLAAVFILAILVEELAVPTNALLLVMMVAAVACRIRAQEPYHKAQRGANVVE